MVEAPGWFERKQGWKVYKNTFRMLVEQSLHTKKSPSVFRILLCGCQGYEIWHKFYFSWISHTNKPLTVSMSFKTNHSEFKCQTNKIVSENLLLLAGIADVDRLTQWMFWQSKGTKPSDNAGLTESNNSTRTFFNCDSVWEQMTVYFTLDRGQIPWWSSVIYLWTRIF